ncbi:TlpA family protein disulfide reductase [Neolewinella antarctica]|uniref:Nitrous oxide reductase accessory protein NosL n=1 Tax=Neolewinella antarctica TaxID=442734 RepID=A0ABX0XD20_9BACT|nr:hypothetical protein [Neolewinella antarctica]NJC27151.1 nitrous oxide reductase accessory protein NosL [Neolewinella antarctica]
MPTYDRHISVGEDTVKNIDENKRRYDYLDHRFTELVRGNRWPSNLVSIDIMVNDFRREYRVTDTLNSKNDGAKDWLRAFGAEEAELFAYSRSLHLANYLRYIGQDTLLLSETTENKIIDLLGTNALYYRPSYIDLFREYSWYHRIDNNLSGADYVLRDFLTLYFLPAHRNDAVAYYIDMVNNSSWTEFEDRDQYDSIRNSLPPSHQGLLSVNPFDATKVAASKKDDLLQFFGREFVADENNRKRKILNDDIDKITLYKFWFVGCRPCVVQQEFEQGLLEEFADLEIVYVCHSSSKSSWLNYQQELSVDVKYGVYVPSVTSEDLETATGRLGAPLYVLMDGAEEIVCDDCPNPSGNTLRELIATHHN